MAASFPYRAVLLSILGAVMGSILWVLIAIAGDVDRAIPALLIGIFAGTAPRLEPRRDERVRLVAIMLTLVGLVVVQYFVLRHAVVTELVETGRDRSIPMFLSPGAMWSVTFGWLRIYPIDALLWAFSLAAAAVLPAGGEQTGSRGVASLASEA